MINCLHCNEQSKLRKTDARLLQIIMDQLQNDTLRCSEHADQSVVYICPWNNRLLCSHCILTAEYDSRVSKLIPYRKKDVTELA